MEGVKTVAQAPPSELQAERRMQQQKEKVKQNGKLRKEKRKEVGKKECVECDFF